MCVSPAAYVLSPSSHAEGGTVAIPRRWPGIATLVISGLDDDLPDTYVFHAGTRTDGDRCVTNGGRVLCVVGLGVDVSAAQRAAYARVDRIAWDGMFCRRDIGYRAVARERSA